MKSKTIFFLTVVLFTTLFTGASILSVITKEPTTPQKIQAKAPEKLSEKSYEKIKQDLFEIVQKEDPRKAINTLKTQMDTDPAVLHSCHELLHEVGNEAYKKYQDFGKAITFKDDICVSGYMHGVIEGYFAKVTDITAATQTLCKNYPQHTFISWECYHGVGHGLMYFNENDVPQALEGCKTYTDPIARSACSNGVYMENFNADSLIHKTRYVNPDKPYYPCNEFEQDKGDCYMNAPIYFLTLVGSDYAKASLWCDEAENPYQYNCYYGLASQITRRHMDNPKLVEQFCTRSKPHVTEPCIRGMVGWYISYFARLNEATAMCSQLENKNKSLCIAEVESFRNQF